MSINIRDEMKRIPGVGRTRNNGSRRYSMRIWLKPDRMTAYRLTTTDVMNAIREQNVATAAGVIGGQPNSGNVNLTYPISAEGRLATAEEFGAIIVKANPDGSMVRLRNIARVELGAKAYTLDSRLDGGPAAILGIYLLPGANALEVSGRVRARMAELEKRFPEGLEWLVVYDNAEFIQQSHHRGRDHPDRGAAAGGSGGLPVPAGLAHHADSLAGGTGVGDRYVYRHAGDGVFPEYREPARPGAGHRDRGG